MAWERVRVYGLWSMVYGSGRRAWGRIGDEKMHGDQTGASLRGLGFGVQGIWFGVSSVGAEGKTGTSLGMSPGTGSWVGTAGLWFNHSTLGVRAFEEMY